jgi:arylsulfatase A-like enzyme
MFTGRLPHQTTADWLTPLDATHRTLAEIFDAQGYRTVGIAANLLYCTLESGLARGFSDYKGPPVSWPMVVKNSWLARGLLGRSGVFGMNDGRVRKRAWEVNAEFLAWLSVPSEKPFFAFLNYFDAHFPYRTPPPYDRRFGTGGPPLDLSDRTTWSAEEIQYVVDGYDSSLAYIDLELDRLFGALEEKGLLENTLIVVTSDHGEHLGEHGLIGHGNSLYRSVLEVPLLMSFRGRMPQGIRIRDAVSLADLPATILDLAGLEGTSIPGQSLTLAWQLGGLQGRATLPFAEVSKGINTPEWEPVHTGPLKSIVASGMHYIRHSDGREELYDFERDAAETNDLSSRPESRPGLEEARRALDRLLTPPSE